MNKLLIAIALLLACSGARGQLFDQDYKDYSATSFADYADYSTDLFPIFQPQLPTSPSPIPVKEPVKQPTPKPVLIPSFVPIFQEPPPLAATTLAPVVVVASPSPVPVPASPSPSPTPVPTPQTVSPSPLPIPSPSPSPQPVTVLAPQNIKGKPSPPPKNRPPPPKKSTSGDDSGVDTTTIIIAVCAGVGGLLVIVIGTVVWCSCRRKKDSRDGNKDVEHGYDANGNYVSAEDVFKAEQRGMPPPRSASSARYPPQHSMHAIPMAMLEPSDIAAITESRGSGRQMAAPTLATTGPLGAGISASGPMGSGMVALSSGHSMGARSTGASPSKTRSRPAPSITPTASGQQPEYNDALLTWIGGQLSNEPRPVSSQSRGGSGPATSSRGSMPPPAPRIQSSPSRSQLVDVSPYEVDFAALRMGKRIGEGSFGKVYLATWNETPVAVKVLVDETTALDQLGRANGDALRQIATPVLEKLREEAGLMASLRHPNILQFMGLCTMPPCVLTEYCSKGSLADVLRAGRQGKPGAAEVLGWRRRLDMALDAATGMLHLHARSPPIVHRDLKSANLLVDAHWKVKVADFNLSRLLEDNVGGSSMTAMNPRWLAPELLAGEGATAASDVFAFGVVMWEMLTWQLPWAKDGPWTVVNMVGNGGRLQIPSRWDIPGPDNQEFDGLDDFISLLQRCWSQNPYDRPSFAEIILELREIGENVPSLGDPMISRLSSPASVAPSVSRTDRSQSVAEPDYEDNLDDEYDEYARQMLSVNASVSSTAVAASMNDLRSMPQYASRGGGWGSNNGPPPAQR